MFSTLPAMIEAYKLKRASTIFFSETDSPTLNKFELFELMSLIFIQGSRFILITETLISRLANIAICANFRDIIPISLNDKEWLQRIKYSSSRKPIILPASKAMFSLSHNTSINVPIRIEWISYTHMRLETSFKPKTNDLLKLNGGFAEHLGVDHLIIKVEQIENTHLKFRLSCGVIAEIKSTKLIQSRIRTFIDKLSNEHDSPALSVFVVAQSVNLRNDIQTALSDKSYLIHLALNRNSILEDPKYITPDVILIEGKFCLENIDTVRELISSLSEGSHIVIIGNIDKISTTINFNLKNIHLLTSLKKELRPLFERLSKYKNKKKSNDIKGYLSYGDVHALGYLTVSARITLVHPTSIQLNLRYPLKIFSLVKLNSSWLNNRVFKKTLYLKIVDSYINSKPDDQGVLFISDAIFINIDSANVSDAAHRLSTVFLEAMNKVVKNKKIKVIGLDESTQIVSKKHSDKSDNINQYTSRHNYIKKNKKQKNSRMAITFIGVSAIFIFIIYLIFKSLLPYWQPSGSEYSKSLKRVDKPS